MEKVLPYRAKRDTIARYTESDCFKLAPELSKRTGWKLTLLTSEPVDLESECPGYMGHVVVTSPCGKYALDIHGVTTLFSTRAKWQEKGCIYMSVFDFEDGMKELRKWYGSWGKGEPPVRTAQRILRSIGTGLEALA